MNQTCKVCGEPAAGFHFGAFTCEGCKSFFGRSYNNLSSISECKNNGKCVIDKKNRTTCKACRLRKCYTVGMSKGGSRYGRRSNWFKIHCLLQEQQQQAVEAATKAAANGSVPPNAATAAGHFGDMAAAAAAAQQQFSQRSSHLAAAAAAGAPHLGYPSYLPEMSGSPFMSAAALPFFSMMNSMPTMAAGSPPSAFQMPPHLLFPGYHPAAAAAAADAAYRSEMYKHRQSVDSAASSESHSRFSPTNHSVHSLTQEEPARNVNRESPELCVSGDDDEHERRSLHSQHSISPVASGNSNQYQIHSPVAIRASPLQHTHQQEQQSQQPQPPIVCNAPVPSSPEPTFAAKMQSLSPVSVCSITNETSPVNRGEEPMNQDCPMDLSMKTSRSSVNSDSDMLSDASEEERQQSMRRKFYQLNQDSESCENSFDSEASKRQKLSETAYHFGAHNPHAQRGIVCI